MSLFVLLVCFQNTDTFSIDLQQQMKPCLLVSDSLTHLVWLLCLRATVALECRTQTQIIKSNSPKKQQHLLAGNIVFDWMGALVYLRLDQHQFHYIGIDQHYKFKLPWCITQSGHDNTACLQTSNQRWIPWIPSFSSGIYLGQVGVTCADPEPPGSSVDRSDRSVT